MQRPDRIRLQHMLDATNERAGVVRGKHRSDLDTDRKLVLSLIKELEIIGEAAGKSQPRSERNTLLFPGRISVECVIV